ncbi:MAG: hypothetical protein MUF48_13870 [Pirellulaceae bacterium]|nr:hypothetical protein [Pirellulaceae bacterium]
MTPLAMLAQVEAIQKEIAVTDEQKSKLQEMAQAMRGQGGGQRNPQEMTDEERQQWREEMTKRRAEQDKKIAGILDAKQVERLKQIQIQASGAAVAMNEEMAAELKITEEQQTKVREGLRDLWQSAQGGGPGAFAEMREKGLAILMEVLTDDQKAVYKKMAGEPFDLSQLPMPGRGGGQRRGN